MELDFAVVADGINARQDAKLDIFGAGVARIYSPAQAMRVITPETQKPAL